MSPDSLTPATPIRTSTEIFSSSSSRGTLRVESATASIQRIGANVRITPQARNYALWELARRAGVSQELFRTWVIRHEENGTSIEVFPARGKSIFFPFAKPDLLQQLSTGQFGCERGAWPYEPSPKCKELIPDFVIPFAASERRAGPLFRTVNSDRIECSVDLPLAVLLVLSRWEELITTSRDEHGRFASRQSIAFREGFLERPIVDEYGLAFEQVLTFLNPGWRSAERKFKAKLSHDADHVGLPFRGKNVLRHAAKRNLAGASRELYSWLPQCDPEDLRAVREIVTVTREYDLDSAVYWMASPPSARDSGYDPRHQKIRRTIDWLTRTGVEMGVQPGYSTFRSPERLRREIASLREVLGDGPLGGRQHYLRWCLDTWIHWEMCGLAYDSTVCYADHIGFRAGTCIPYRPWLLSLNRTADLLEIPLIVMDRTLLEYMHLSEEMSVDAVRRCVARCQLVGGTFTMVWHNNTLLERKYRSLYMKLLPLLQRAERFDWKSECASLEAEFPRKPACAIGK